MFHLCKACVQHISHLILTCFNMLYRYSYVTMKNECFVSVRMSSPNITVVYNCEQVLLPFLPYYCVGKHVKLTGRKAGLVRMYDL